MKLSIINRLIAAILAAAVIPACFSCASEPTESDVPENSDTSTDAQTQAETNRLAELGSKDFEGRIFTILDANDYPDLHINISGDEMNGDIINDALIERDMFVENEYNAKVEYVQIVNAAQGVSTLRSSVLADEQIYDLCISTLLGGTLATVANEGVLANLLDVPYLSLNQNWWSKLLYESLNINGKMYYTSGDISPSMYLAPSALFINMKLMEDYQIDADIFEMVENGTWTIDKIDEIFVIFNDDLNGDSVMSADDDFFGYMHTLASLSSNMLLVGAGVELCSNTGSNIEINLSDSHVSDVIDKIKNIALNIKYNDQNDMFNKTFVEDRAIIVQHSTGLAIKPVIREMKSDFIVVPLAKYDESQESYYSLVNAWCDSFIGIPVNADLEFVGFLSEAMAYYSYENIRPKSYETVLKGKYMRDEKSAEMIDLIFDSLYIDFNALYNFGGICDRLCDVIFKDAPLASALAETQEKAKVEIETFLENW